MSEVRQQVVAAAESWIGTPFHHKARIKGAGVDCLMLLAEVYESVGLIPHVKVEHYPPDWHMHRDAERYLAGMMHYAREIEGPPLPGDAAVFKFGRVYSHGTIVTVWPRIIHAYWSLGVVRGDANLLPLLGHEVKFFSVIL